MLSLMKSLAVETWDWPKILSTLVIASPTRRPRMARATMISKRVKPFFAVAPRRLTEREGPAGDNVRGIMGRTLAIRGGEATQNEAGGWRQSGVRARSATPMGWDGFRVFFVADH